MLRRNMAVIGIALPVLLLLSWLLPSHVSGPVVACCVFRGQPAAYFWYLCQLTDNYKICKKFSFSFRPH